MLSRKLIVILHSFETLRERGLKPTKTDLKTNQKWFNSTVRFLTATFLAGFEPCFYCLRSNRPSH